MINPTIRDRILIVLCVWSMMSVNPFGIISFFASPVFTSKAMRWLLILLNNFAQLQLHDQHAVVCNLRSTNHHNCWAIKGAGAIIKSDDLCSLAEKEIVNKALTFMIIIIYRIFYRNFAICKYRSYNQPTVLEFLKQGLELDLNAMRLYEHVSRQKGEIIWGFYFDSVAFKPLSFQM